MIFSRLLPLVAALSAASCSSSDPSKCTAGATNAAIGGCTSVTVVGDPNACGFSSAGAQPQSVCDRLCGGDAGGTFGCTYDPSVSSDTVHCKPNGALCTGRRPSGYHGPRERARTPGDYFAALAALEAASVDAFAILRDEIESLDAPRELVDRASRARGDEVRHVKAMRALAERFGGVVAPEPHVTRAGARSLFEVALENAVEGCVRETFGAAVGAWQARHASDVGVRSAFGGVAADEARHADLAWDVHIWAMARLDTAPRARIECAMADAIALLSCEIAEPVTALNRVGLPRAGQAHALLDLLGRELWNQQEAA